MSNLSTKKTWFQSACAIAKELGPHSLLSLNLNRALFRKIKTRRNRGSWAGYCCFMHQLFDLICLGGKLAKFIIYLPGHAANSPKLYIVQPNIAQLVTDLSHKQLFSFFNDFFFVQTRCRKFRLKWDKSSLFIVPAGYLDSHLAPPLVKLSV